MGITIFYIILYVVEAFILWQYCTTVFQSRRGKLFEIFTCIAGYGILFFISQFSEFWSNLLSILVVHFFVMMVSYKSKWYTALLHSGISTMILSSTELIVLAILSRFTTNIYVELSYFVLGSFISKLLYFIVLFAISHIIKNHKEHRNKPDHGGVILIVVPITSTGIAITLFSVCLNTELTFIQDLFVSISGVLVLVINLLIFYYYDYSQTMNDNYTDLQIRLQKENDTSEYYKMLVEHDDKQRILIHDIKNHLSTILNMNESNSRDKVSEYITQIINEPAMQTSLKICDNELLNVLLNRYKKICATEGIEFKTDIRKNSVNFLKDEEITSLFANLLDNAIEAARQSDAPYIEINASSKPDTAFTLINIINACTEKPLVDYNGNLITRKIDRRSHGIGMKSVKHIIDTHEGTLDFRYDESNKEFVTNIILKSS